MASPSAQRSNAGVLMTDWSSGLLVFLGGGVGATARWGIARLATLWPMVQATAFPWATFVINVLGSFALGCFLVMFAERPGWRLLLGTGLCGGFTTMSTFSTETLELLAKGHTATATLYMSGTLVACIAGAWLGMRLLKA
jgi:fluoride exporter